MTHLHITLISMTLILSSLSLTLILSYFNKWFDWIKNVHVEFIRGKIWMSSLPKKKIWMSMHPKIFPLYAIAAFDVFLFLKKIFKKKKSQALSSKVLLLPVLLIILALLIVLQLQSVTFHGTLLWERWIWWWVLEGTAAWLLF